MRVVFFIIPLVLIVLASSGYGQTVTLTGTNLPFKKVFSTIKSQTGYMFFYDAALLKEARPLTLALNNASLGEALNQIFLDQPFDWVLEEKTITITAKSTSKSNTAVTSPADQPVKISGKVEDTEGNPIEGASVVVKGTRHGTSTNAKGSFSIPALKGNELVFSSVSYTKKQVVLDGRSPVVQLELAFHPMEKLVVGGNIMPTKRKATVASVSVIDSATLESLPNQTIDLIYRCLVAGTNHIQAGYETPQYKYFSGTVSIRGAAGFSGYGIVKVYVDGVEFAGGSYYLNTLDKNSIDHIEVVKGPAASAFYGSGSDGGVILVYTKKPALRRTNINVSSSAGWYDSKWQDKKPFRQLHAFTVAQGFKNVAYLIAGDIQKYNTYMPGGNQSRHSLFGKLSYTWNTLNVVLSGQHFGNEYSPVLQRQNIPDPVGAL